MPNTSAGCALDAEFVFLLSLLRPLYAELPSKYRDCARAWLQRLCWAPAYGDAARADRNEYLCRLYMGMQKEVLEGVFLEEPPEGQLLPPGEVFPAAGNPAAWLDTVVECGGDGAIDERTYLATHTLPDGGGAFGYLAVSMAKGEPHFVTPKPAPRPGPKLDSGPALNRDPGPTDSLDLSFGEPLATSTPRGHRDRTIRARKGIPDTETPKLHDVLRGRPPPEQRRRLVELYDSLLEDVRQAEMEPSVPSPDLDKLITSCQGLSVDSNDTTEQRKELLSQFKSRLRARREQVSRRSEMLDSLLSQPQAARAEFEVAMEDEDSVWNIRPENVAMLEAAYPKELVRRFLDGIVRERVAALGRVQARRYCKNHVNGVEIDAAEDMEHYREALGSWASMLEERAEGSPELIGVAGATRKEALRCVELATQSAGRMRELDAARRGCFRREEELRAEQERLRADIELLRAEKAAQQRKLDSLQRNG